MSKPNCYKCKHRGTVPGSAHSSCKHPSLGKARNDPMLSILATLASVNRVESFQLQSELNVTAKQHGIDNGWFIWPWNFDPVWLLTCNGFQEKEAK